MNVPEGFPVFKSGSQCECGGQKIQRGGSTLKVQLHSSGCQSAPKRKPIRKRAKVSKKLPEGRLQQGSDEWREEREKVLERSGGRCELVLPGQCWGIAHDAHHVLSRRRGGSDYETNLKAACRPCHTWVETHPKQALELGLMRHSWDGEAS